MFATARPLRGFSRGNWVRRVARFIGRILRAFLIGAAAFGPPRPPPEPPSPQTTEQVSDDSSLT